MRAGKLVVGRAAYKTPASLSREVGRIIVHWAYFEHYLQDIVWLLLDLDDKRGRVAVRDPRAEDRIDMIADLAALRGINLPTQELAKFKSRTKEIAALRDLLAHGRWVKHPNNHSFRVVRTRGNYPKDVRGDHSRKRRIDPEAIEPTVAGLRSIIDAIKGLIGGACSLKSNIEQQLASLQKSQ